MKAPQGEKTVFSAPFLQKGREMAHPVPTKAIVQPGPDTAMLFAPFGCTHPPPSVPPFLPMQNLFPKDFVKVTSQEEA